MPGERARPFVEVEVGVTQREVDPLRRQALRMRDRRGQCGEIAVTARRIGGETLVVVVLLGIAADDGNAANRPLQSGGRSVDGTRTGQLPNTERVKTSREPRVAQKSGITRR